MLKKKEYKLILVILVVSDFMHFLSTIFLPKGPNINVINDNTIIRELDVTKNWI